MESNNITITDTIEIINIKNPFDDVLLIYMLFAPRNNASITIIVNTNTYNLS